MYLCSNKSDQCNYFVTQYHADQLTNEFYIHILYNLHTKKKVQLKLLEQKSLNWSSLNEVWNCLHHLYTMITAAFERELPLLNLSLYLLLLNRSDVHVLLTCVLLLVSAFMAVHFNGRTLLGRVNVQVAQCSLALAAHHMHSNSRRRFSQRTRNFLLIMRLLT